MANFTPGPWKWQPYEAGGNALVNAAGVRIHSDGSACDEYGPDIDVNGPDANLIAAAPEMYRDLTAAIRSLEITQKTLLDMGGSSMPTLDAMIAQGKQTLAKAEGKSNG